MRTISIAFLAICANVIAANPTMIDDKSSGSNLRGSASPPQNLYDDTIYYYETPDPTPSPLSPSPTPWPTPEPTPEPTPSPVVAMEDAVNPNTSEEERDSMAEDEEISKENSTRKAFCRKGGSDCTVYLNQCCSGNCIVNTRGSFAPFFGKCASGNDIAQVRTFRGLRKS